MGVQALSTSGLAAFSRGNVASNGLRSLLLTPSLIAQIGTYTGPSQGFSSIEAVTRDAQGNLYVRHNWATGGGGVAKFAPDFTVLWSRRYPDLTSSQNRQAIGFDLSGNLLTGTSIDTGDGRVSFGLISINPDTGEMNQATFNSVRFTSFNANPQNNICATIGIRGSLYSVVDYNPGGIIAVQPVKYNLSGFQSAGAGIVFGSDTRTDGIMEQPDGQAVFAFYNAFTNNNPIGWNPVVVKYSADLGSVVFKRVIGRANAGQGANYTYGAHVRNDGAPVVSWSNFGDLDPLGITQLDANGNNSWTWRSTQLTIRPATRGVVRDSAGNVYLLARLQDSSQSYLIKFNSSGTVLWQRSFTASGPFTAQSLTLSADEAYVTFGGNNTIFGTGVQTFINYPADGSITGSYSMNYVNWTIASSSISFTSYTSQNVDFAASTYSNSRSTDSRNISTTSSLISLTPTRTFI